MIPEGKYTHSEYVEAMDFPQSYINSNEILSKIKRHIINYDEISKAIIRKIKTKHCHFVPFFFSQVK